MPESQFSSQESVVPAPAIRRAIVIANPASGQDQPVLGVLNKAFQDAGIDWDMLITKGGGDARTLAEQAVAQGADVVAAYGGDGTVMEVANGLFGTGVPLAILPGGTANVMAAELGIPGDLPGAAAVICSGDSLLRTVDMGQIGDLKFMLRVTVGFTAQMTKGADREFKQRVGSLAYALSALRELPNAQTAQYRLTLDGGEVVEIEALTCLVANSGHIGLPNARLIPTMSVSDGLLDVVMVQGANLGSLLSVAASAAGVATPLPHWQVRAVTVEADPPQTVECDGEVLEPTPFSARVLPQAMRVLVPRQAVPPEAARPADGAARP